MRAFAERLIADETKGDQSPGIQGPAAFRVFEKLRPHLATLMGNTGFRGLISRALMLASAEDPRLRGVLVRADGTLEVVPGGWAPADPEARVEGNVTLVAQLLGLLVAFVGENLTLKIVAEVWPGFSLRDFDFEPGDRK